MQISAGEKFCQHCGAPVASRAAAAPSGATDAPRGSSGSRWLWIAALLVLVATGAALLYRLLSLRRANPGSVELTVATAPAGEQRPPAGESANRLEESPPSVPARGGESGASRRDGEPASTHRKEASGKEAKLAPDVGDAAASRLPKNQAAVQSAQAARSPAPDSVANSAATSSEPAAGAPTAAPPASEASPPPSRPSRPRIHLLKPDPSETPPAPAAAPSASQPGPSYGSDAAASRLTLHRAPAAPGEPAAAPEPVPYPGPSAGTLIWSGQVEKDTLIRIEGDRVSPGRLTGELPGVPVTIDVPSDSLAIVEGPSEANHYKRLYLRSLKRLRSAVVIKWTVRQ
jgi:hypothetical protein